MSWRAAQRDTGRAQLAVCPDLFESWGAENVEAPQCLHVELTQEPIQLPSFVQGRRTKLQSPDLAPKREDDNFSENS